MSNNTKTRLIKPMRTRDDLGKWDVKNTTASTLARGSVLRVNGTVSTGAYHTVELAIADGTQSRSQLLVVWADHEADTVSIASERRLVTMDTSSAAVGDLVYLSDVTAGAITLLVSSEPIGRVHVVGGATAGMVWIDPKWALASTSAADLDKYRPDVDLDWEARIAAGDGKVHVDGATGSDTTGDGTPTLPYLTIGAAIMDIPHNRTATALRAVTIELDTPGLSYSIPSHLEATSLITVKGTLPTATETGTFTSDFQNISGVASSVQKLKTDIAYVAPDDYKGWLIKYSTGKYGWVIKSEDSGGFAKLWTTQNTNGVVYDTIAGGEAFELWNPVNLCTVISANTGGNGTNFSQMDNFKFNFCRMSSVGGSGKLVFYQSRTTLQNCHVGADIGRVYANNGNLTINNCWVETEGELQEFGMVGVGPLTVLQIRGGTVFEGTTATSTNNWPIAATGNSRVIFGGVGTFRNCRGLSLANGAQIGYASGYSEYVNLQWYDTEAGEPLVEVTLRDDGVPVTGTIPDCHGEELISGTVVVIAKAPAQLYWGRDSTINILGKTGYYPFSLTNDAVESAGHAYDGSFVRIDRARDTAASPGTSWGPYEEVITGGTVSLGIDWANGPSQVFDLTDATMDDATITWTTPANGSVGNWVTLTIKQADNVTHSWNAVAYEWMGGEAPTLSTVSGDVDILRFHYNGSTWIGEHVKSRQTNVRKIRLQLADMPAALTTGSVAFGAAIPANTVVTGGLLYLNVDPNAGASGITALSISLGLGNAGLTLGSNIFSTIDVIGETGSPKYLDGFTNLSDFSIGPFAIPVAGTGFYDVTAVGANLDQMTALDFTIILFVSNTVLDVP